MDDDPTPSSPRRPASPGRKTHKLGVGGRDHMIMEGSLTPNQAALKKTPDFAFSMSHRDRPLVAVGSLKKSSTGGVDHIRFGSDDTVYTCSLKEAQQQLSLQPQVREHLEHLPGAGMRAPERERKVHAPVGGAESVGATLRADDSGFGGSVAEAQQKIALDPAARADADRVTVAGRRVEPRWLGSSIRTLQPVGGAATVALDWRTGAGASPEDAAAAGRSGNYSGGSGGLRPSSSVPSGRAAAGGLESVRLMHPEQPVGGRSGFYLEAAASARSAAVASAGGSGGMTGIMSWGSSDARPRTAAGCASEAASLSAILSSPRLRKEQPLGGRPGNAAGVDLSGLGSRPARPQSP